MSIDPIQVVDLLPTRRAAREERPWGRDAAALKIWYKVDAILRCNDGMTERVACQRAGIAYGDFLEAYRKVVDSSGTRRRPAELRIGARTRVLPPSDKQKYRGLPDDVVLEIRRRVDAGEKVVDVAKALGCAKGTVSNISRRITRKDVG